MALPSGQSHELRLPRFAHGQRLRNDDRRFRICVELRYICVNPRFLHLTEMTLDTGVYS